MSTTPAGAPAARAYRPAGADVLRFLQENAVFGPTRRFRQLDRFEAHWKGVQYEHQKYDWWGRSAATTETASPDVIVPEGFDQMSARDDLEIRQKKPTAPRNLCKTIVKRLTGLLFSNKRRPRVVVENDPDSEAFLEAVRESAKFWSVMRAARNLGGAVGSVCVTAHIREGKFSYEAHNTKNLQVIWKDRRTWTPLGVLKMYEYPVEIDERDPKTGKLVGTREVSFLYRRIITDEWDIVYKPARLDDGEEMTWEPDDALMVHHALGYFPGVWIQNESDGEEMDGAPDLDGSWATLDTGDRLLAQINKGTILNLDPTAVLAYDDKKVIAGGGLMKGSDHSIYVGEGGSAAYMEINGQGIEKGIALLKVLKQDVLDGSRCVLLDPEQISGSAQSAKAIEYIYAPMTEHGDDLRDQYGPAIIELMHVTEKMARQISTTSVELAPDVDGTRRVGVFEFFLPPRKVQDDDGKVTTVAQKLGTGGGYVQLEWGPYFAPSASDDADKIKNAAAANQASLIDIETAAASVAPIFQVRDVAGTVKRARAEADERAASMMAGLGGGVAPGDDRAPPGDDVPDDVPAGGGAA